MAGSQFTETWDRLVFFIFLRDCFGRKGTFTSAGLLSHYSRDPCQAEDMRGLCALLASRNYTSRGAPCKLLKGNISTSFKTEKLRFAATSGSPRRPITPKWANLPKMTFLFSFIQKQFIFFSLMLFVVSCWNVKTIFFVCVCGWMCLLAKYLMSHKTNFD